MFWKYIEKISWGKVIHHFLGMKQKAMEIAIQYSGWEIFEINFSLRRRIDHGGPCFEIEIFGLEFSIEIYDYNHWNEAEGRFYFEEEPEFSWIGHKNYTEQDYWRDIEKTAEVHHLDENYISRCHAAFMEYKQEREEREAAHKKEDLSEQQKTEKKKPFRLKQPINWTQVKYACMNGSTKKYKVHQLAKNKIKIGRFRRAYIWSVRGAVGWFNFYDERGNLISKASDYDDYPSYLEELSEQ